MIARKFTTSATLKRMTAYTATGSIPKVKQVAGTTIMGYFQALSDGLEAQLGMGMAKTWYFWCSYTADIKESDQLTISSTTYKVKMVKKFADGLNKHTRALLVKEI